MKMNCENILEIVGDWKYLKQFYSEHWDSSGFTLRRDGDYGEVVVIDYTRGLFECEMDFIEYIFLTEVESPFLWLKVVAKKYNRLDFTLRSKIGDNEEEYVYKKGEAYYLDSTCSI